MEIYMRLMSMLADVEFGLITKMAPQLLDLTRAQVLIFTTALLSSLVVNLNVFGVRTKSHL